MTEGVPRVALVGENTFQLEQWAEYLGRTYDVTVSNSAYRAHRRFDEQTFDIVVLDMQRPGLDGAALLEHLERSQPGAQTIIVADPDGSRALAADMRLGPGALVTRPLGDLEALGREIEAALTRRTPSSSGPAALLHGECASMQHVRRLIERFASSDLPVMLLGESGTGKELAARALHASSARAAGPYVAVNCAGLAESLIDSELFGHERGAFTGAQQSHKGLFDAADGGTLFLDEIGDMPPQTQVRLLRTLQEGEVRPVGATRCHHIDVRVISATNVEMKKAVEDGEFRADLYFRLSPIKIDLPPLRERGRDVALLAKTLLVAAAARARRRPPSLSEAVQQALLAYDWPGNVRELKSALEYALSLARGEVIEIEDLPPSVSGEHPTGLDPLVIEAHEPPPANYVQNRKRWLADFDRRYFEQLLRYTRGNLSEAARHSGVDRSNLRRILKDIGLNAIDFRPGSTR